jgi:hypothetical protein
MEIISPIIYNFEDIKFLYKKLYDKNCFKSNKSSGFHVNISLVNQNNNPIFLSYTLLDILISNMEKYEKKNYLLLRPDKTIYANELLKHVQEYTYKDIKKYTKIDNKEFFYNNFITGKKYYRCFLDLSYKYLTLHTKNDTLIEFRIFPSKDDYNNLLEFIKDSLNLFRKSMEEYINNYKNKINELNKLNSEIIPYYEPIEFYDDYLYHKSGIMEKLEEFNEKEWELRWGLNDLFLYHNQEIVKFVNIHENVYVIEVLNQNIDVIDNFKVIIKNDDKVLIQKISF